ncbi:MAG: hypothetical protein ACODAQ_11400, partial [Phycisphaeraceae bacterium]
LMPVKRRSSRPVLSAAKLRIAQYNLRSMLKLAALIENPGEPPIETRYRDPHVLREMGYNGLAIYETTALAGVESAEVVSDSELRRWLGTRIEHVERAIETASAAGLEVHLFYDVLVLPEDVVRQHGQSVTCRGNRAGALCPASEAAFDLSVRALRAMLQRWPAVAGVVLRFGETDAPRLPHLTGNDIYTPHCPRCSQLGRADRIVNTIERFHQLVVGEFDKRLIARAWNVRPGGLHDSVELAQRVVERLPGEERDQRLVLSFKFTHTDFWRYQKWNPASLACGRRPILYELQCQREFEGKGAMPNWQTGLWRDGPPEVGDEVGGLAQVRERVNLAGLWAWVRGGGWGGPFISNESWIDANVFAAPRLADDPQMGARELADAWIAQRLGVEGEALAACVRAILEHSPEVARQAFYIGPLAERKSDPWHPSGDWIQDDLIDAQAAWRIIQRLPEGTLDAAVQEKEAAAARVSADRATLQQLVSDRAHAALEPLVNTLIYAESLCETLRDLIAGLVAYRRFLKQRTPAAAEVARQKMLAAQSHWNHHTQRHGSLPGAATAFREAHFWELTQQVLVEVSEVQARE